MQFWHKGDGCAPLVRGRFLRRALWGLCVTSTFASAQIPTVAPTKKVSTHRVNEVIRAGAVPWTADRIAFPPSPWKTGLGLRVGGPTQNAVQLDEQPDFRSPSTRDGQPLELMYYACDWAGPDVPR
jgi:hypothetical protein